MPTSYCSCQQCNKGEFIRNGVFKNAFKGILAAFKFTPLAILKTISLPTNSNPWPSTTPTRSALSQIEAKLRMTFIRRRKIYSKIWRNACSEQRRRRRHNLIRQIDVEFASNCCLSISSLSTRGFDRRRLVRGVLFTCLPCTTAALGEFLKYCQLYCLHKMICYHLFRHRPYLHSSCSLDKTPVQQYHHQR